MWTAEEQKLIEDPIRMRLSLSLKATNLLAGPSKHEGCSSLFHTSAEDEINFDKPWDFLACLCPNKPTLSPPLVPVSHLQLRQAGANHSAQSAQTARQRPQRRPSRFHRRQFRSAEGTISPATAADLLHRHNLPGVATTLSLSLSIALRSPCPLEVA